MCPVACEHPSGTFGRVACVLTLKSALFAAERLAPFGGLGAQRGSGDRNATDPLLGRPHFARPHAKPLQTPSSEHMASDRKTDKSLVTNSVTGEDGEPLWNGDLTLLSRWLDLCERKIPKVNRAFTTLIKRGYLINSRQQTVVSSAEQAARAKLVDIEAAELV